MRKAARWRQAIRWRGPCDKGGREAHIPRSSAEGSVRISQGRRDEVRCGFCGFLQDARAHCQRFFHCYNNDHRQSGIAFTTPADVHYGRAPDIIATRAQTLDAAFAANPARFKGKRPTPKLLPEAVWINPPAVTTADSGEPPEQH